MTKRLEMGLSHRVWAVLVVALLAAGGTAAALEAGASKVEISPPLGTPLNGYFDRLGRGAVSVHDPVWVRCLYLNDGETSVFLLNADLCVVNRELRDRVLELARGPDGALGVVPEENVILTATHTHSAQGGMIRPLLFRCVSGRFVPEVLDATAAGFVEAMRSAYAARRRASIGYATTRQDDLSENRREDGGPVDPQIGVLRVDDSDGAPVAVLANFAAHPTTVGDEDMLAVSADYCGFYYTELERLMGDACVALFTNGAEGNQRCANPENKKGWERTESIGRILAERVHAAAGEIACGDADLHVGYATPALPPTMGASLMPDSTVLHTLEINDLLLAFFPGEPCVEIGLELRRRALESGYGAQFSVGLSDDHLLYFVPRARYDRLDYECGMNLYGPAVEDWFYREFSKLMTRRPEEPERDRGDSAPLELVGDLSRLRLMGTPYAIGYQRGAAFAEAIREEYEEHVVARCDTGDLVPSDRLWAWAPPFVNLTPLALPRLGIGARPLLNGVSPDVFAELEGLADGAGVPFDAAWLVQCAPTLAARSVVEDLYRSPFCTMFAAVGDRAGADDLLVGRNLDWSGEDLPVVVDVRPEHGHRFVQVGFPWNVGVFTGMNDTGVVVCVESSASLARGDAAQAEGLTDEADTDGEPSLDGAPVEFVLRAILQDCGTTEEALAHLEAAAHLRGYHVLVAGPSAPSGGKAAGRTTYDARVVELGRKRLVREPVDGFLFGTKPAAISTNPDAPEADATASAPDDTASAPDDAASAPDDAAWTRYRRVLALLGEERIVSPEEIEQVLADAAPETPDPGRVFNTRTRHSVVFEPKALRLRVAVPQAGGAPGGYVAIDLSGGTP